MRRGQCTVALRAMGLEEDCLDRQVPRATVNCVYKAKTRGDSLLNAIEIDSRLGF